MYDAGAKACFDVLAVHAYGWTFAPDEPASTDAVNFNRVELVREIMIRNGDGDKHISITEGGWNDHPRWTKAVRPAQRAAYTVRAYRKALAEWPWVDALSIGLSAIPGRRGPIRTITLSWTVSFSPSRSI